MKKVKKYITKNKLVLIILFLVLCMGFYLRVGGIISNSFAYTYDVGRDLLQVQLIVIDHKIPLIGQTTGLGGLYYGPWWYYLLTPPFIISGGNPQGIAFFMVLTGILTIILGYVFGSRIGGRLLGIIIATFISFSSVMVGFSAQIWNPNVAPLYLLILFILLFTNPKRKSSQFINCLCIGLLLGLLLDAEIVFGVLIITGIVLSIIFLKKRGAIALPSVGYVIGFLIILLPRLFFELRHNFVMTRSLFAMHGGDQKIFEPENFFHVLPDRLSTFLGQFSDTLGLSLITGLVLLIAILTTFLVLRHHFSKNEKKLLGIFTIIMLVFVIGSSLFARALWGHYLVGLPLIYILFVSVWLYALSRKNKIISIILFIILAIFSMKPLGVIAGIENPNWEGNAAVYRNQLAVIDYVYKDAKGANFNEIVYTPVVLDYTYRYLFSWYGKKQYGYVPAVKTEHLFYVIIEPDPGYEGRIKDWLKIREGDGKIVKDAVVKGGIRVQKRLR